MALLSRDDAAKLEALVEYVETYTSAEIVVIEAAACGGWAAQRAWLAGGMLLVASFGVLALIPALPAIWLVALQAALAPFAWYAAGRPVALHWLVPREAGNAAVEARARQLFAERGLHKTRQRNGVLILISDLERRVTMLADEGIAERLGPDEWRRGVDQITAAIRSGRAVEGVSAVIQMLGEKLAIAFPRSDEDADELSDAVLRVD
jgi:putative membrane protein